MKTGIQLLISYTFALIFAFFFIQDVFDIIQHEPSVLSIIFATMNGAFVILYVCIVADILMKE